MKLLPAIKQLSLFFILLLQITFAYSQGFSNRNKYSTIEIGYSNASFLGRDLPLKSNRSLSPGLSVAFYTKQTPRISNGFKFSMNYPTSRGFGRKDSIADYSFVYYQTRIIKYEFFLLIDLIQHRGRNQKRPDFVPYIYTGIGWLKMKQQMRYGFEDKVTVQSLTNKRYDKRSMVLPIGIGIRYKLTTYTNLSLEVIYNYTFTNQLDLEYTTKFSYSKKNDSYLTINLALSFI